jgi:hypothetical protein
VTGADPSQAPQAPWWREAATALGVLGLFVTLLFNTFGVWQGTRQQQQSRETEQINLLTELNAKATETEAAINATRAPLYLCAPNRSALVAKNTDSALRAALDYYEYLAWLFNRDRLTVEDSRTFFSNRMNEGWCWQGGTSRRSSSLRYSPSSRRSFAGRPAAIVRRRSAPDDDPLGSIAYVSVA